MAWENSQLKITLMAAADLSSSQYRFVTVDGDGKAALSSDDGNAIGVLQNTPEAGEAATIAISGVTKLYIGTTGSLDSGSIRIQALTAWALRSRTPPPTVTSFPSSLPALMVQQFNQHFRRI
mgnify:CR=1 FL=1